VTGTPGRGRPSRLSRWAGGLGRLIGRLGVPAREWACVVPIMLLAAADRFVNLPARGIWDTDQGVEMGAIWSAVQAGRLPTFGSPAFTTGPTFHHGALFYDLMMPVSWATNGNPTAALIEIALFGFAVVPLLWWTALAIGGMSAGLATALLAAVSPSLIDYSTFVWNPVLLEAGAALACYGAWQAWTTHGPRWWVVAAAGTALASQSHLTGLVLVLPMTLLFLAALRRGPAAERRGLVEWGAAGLGVFVLTWLPWIVNELGHGFAETQAILAFKQEDQPAADPVSRLVVSTIRILAWPMTHWPRDNVSAAGIPNAGSGFAAALAVATGILAGLIWRVVGALTDREPIETGPETAGPRARLRPFERSGLLFVGGSLLLITATLGLALPQMGRLADINQEQYHVVADVFVILAGGLIVSGLWHAAPLRGRARSGRVLGSLALAVLAVAGVTHWPPLTSPDGGWPAAQMATQRLERDAGAPELALVALPTLLPPDAYGYPLKVDGFKLVAPAGARTVVVLCYPSWAQKWSLRTCGGAAESDWIAANLAGRSLTLVDTWEPAPDRVLSVYRLAP
jgi:4-amino-4-deoxy-L-arabinose transferase-like glycosyltransferase